MHIVEKTENFTNFPPKWAQEMLEQMNIMELENKKNTTGEKGPSIDKTEVQPKSFEEDTAVSGNQRKIH